MLYVSFSNWTLWTLGTNKLSNFLNAGKERSIFALVFLSLKIDSRISEENNN